MRVFFESDTVTIWQGDSRTAWEHLPEASVDAIVTSPPYFGLRDYGVDGQLGLEATPDAYITDLADLLTGYGERVLKPGGSLWLNLGDSYAGSWGNYRASGEDPNRAHLNERHGTDRPASSRVDWPRKSLMLIPERVALALIDRGWILRNKVVWHKPNAMPSSVTDRLNTTWEPIFHLVRDRTYHYDLEAIGEPVKYPEAQDGSRVFGGRKKADHGKYGSAERTYGQNIYGYRPADGKQHRAPRDWRNPGDVWSITTKPYPEAHFATFPPDLMERPILATVPEGGIVLDPFFGAGTTAVTARQLGRRCWGVELNPDYCELAASRFLQEQLPLAAT